MSNEYNRMKSLLENVGLSFTETGITNGEITAYAAGLALVRQELENAEKAVFILQNGSTELSRYASLLNLDESRYTVPQLKAAIVDRLSHGFGEYIAEDFVNAFETIGSGEYEFESIDYGSGVDPDIKDIAFRNFDFEDLRELGKFIKAFLHTSNTYYDGTGLTFDEWDAYGCTFNYYDSLCLPFNIIDHLSVN